LHAAQVARYRNRISGPLLIASTCTLNCCTAGEHLIDEPVSVETRVIAARVAREGLTAGATRQVERPVNAREVAQHCALSPDSRALLTTAIKRLDYRRERIIVS